MLHPPSTSILALTLLVLTGCGGGGGSDPLPGTDAILLLSLDTLRADRTSLHGYQRPTTPHLEELAEGATLYPRALATAPWTLPSHASMFTGLFPFEHGARTVALSPREREEGTSNAAPLDEDYLTLAEVLSVAGYRTGAIAANVSFLEAKYGLAQGFDHYDIARGKVREVNERALAWIDEAPDEPFFLFLNYMDTHRPYNTDPVEGFDRVGDHRKIIKTLKKRMLAGGEVPDEWLQIMSMDYDLSVANLDLGLKDLFEALRTRGILDRALLVITSDHGEYLGEHDYIEHAKDVYQEVVHVPFLVKEPGQVEGRVDADWISHVHIPGIVLDHARVPRDLPELAPLRSNWPRGPVVAENYGARLRDLEEAWGARLDRVRRAYVSGDTKWIETSDGTEELYDLAGDPGESNNLMNGSDDRAGGLRKGLDAWKTARRDGESTKRVLIDAAEVSVLEELGYGPGLEEQEEEDR